MRRGARRVVAAAVVASPLGASGGGSARRRYVLRATFDSGSGLRTGMDVRVAGLRVGRVRSIDLDQSDPAMPRAVAVLEITDPAAGLPQRRPLRHPLGVAARRPRHRLQLAQPRAPGAVKPPPPTARRWPGSPAARRADLLAGRPDLVARRLPPAGPPAAVDRPQRAGTGLAGNGGALRDAIRRADPAFLQLERTLDVLATQRRALGGWPSRADRVLAPLAREREHLAGFVGHGNELFSAVGRRRDALRETFRRLPAFLRELRPTLRELDALAGQARPGAGRPRRGGQAAERRDPRARADRPRGRPACGRSAARRAQQRGPPRRPAAARSSWSG